METMTFPTMLPTDTTSLRALFDVEQQVPLLDGRFAPYINFDNAASTPPLRAVQQAVNNFMPWYASVHRGNGFKSQLATHAYETARAITLHFVGADPSTHVCIFGKNTTEALNKAARRIAFAPGRDVVLVSMLEHHSNDLPYRAVANVVHVGVTAEGELDEADFDRKLRDYAGRIGLVAISGASNVTGILPPLRRLAEKAHAAGAQFLVDAAQLAPHRRIEMGSLDDPGHFDYLALSAHKMYAPYGTGVLVGRRDTFETGEPDLRGGGQVELVTEDHVVWSAPPEREEAGSPNVVGAVALAAVIQQLEAIGMDTVAAHEAELTAYALSQLRKMEGVILYGDTDPQQTSERLGVIPFNLEGISHFLVAAILGHEFGIGVRNGCFCAHPYILRLLQLSPAEVARLEARMRAGNRRQNPGLVRASFGLYNTLAEVDTFVTALSKILRGEYAGHYRQDPASGEFVPENWTPEFADYFAL
ncbi:MAG TPA: aminotransferase class V-fold PLP-dependent enzyme [Anaerolineae bacterium]